MPNRTRHASSSKFVPQTGTRHETPHPDPFDFSASRSCAAEQLSPSAAEKTQVLRRCPCRRGYTTRCVITCPVRLARGGRLGRSQRRQQRDFSRCDGCWSESVKGKNLTTALRLSPSSPWVSHPHLSRFLSLSLSLSAHDAVREAPARQPGTVEISDMRCTSGHFPRCVASACDTLLLFNIHESRLEVLANRAKFQVSSQPSPDCSPTKQCGQENIRGEVPV